MPGSAAVKTEVRATALLAGPMIASLLVQVANGFVDTVMLGRFHPEHLAAGALGSSLWVFVMLAGVGFSMGISPIVAQLNGAGKSDEIAGVFHQGVWLCVLLGVLSFVVLRSIGGILIHLQIDPPLIPLTRSYLSIVAWGMAVSQVYLAGRFVSEGIEYAVPMMIIQLVLLPLNALGNYALIFGNWGFPALGVTGAAISTSFVMILGVVLMFAYLALDRRYRYLHLFDSFQLPVPRQIGKILVISIPIAISMMLESGLFTAVSLLMARLGAITLGGHQIAINYASLMFMIPLGFSMAATVRVGNAVGRGDYTDAARRGQVAIAMATVFMLFSATIIFLFNDVIAAIYTNDAQVISVASSLLIMAGIFQISDGVQISTVGALRGYKDTRFPMYIAVLGYWVVGFPCAWYMAFKLQLGGQGLWWGLISGLTITAVLLLVRFRIISTSYRVSLTRHAQ